MPPTDPLEQYLLDHENDLHMHEKNEIDKIFFEQRPLLKHNLPIETLGGPPPAKGDHVFELKQLPDTLKYAYLDEKNIYPGLDEYGNISLNSKLEIPIIHGGFNYYPNKESNGSDKYDSYKIPDIQVFFI